MTSAEGGDFGRRWSLRQEVVTSTGGGIRHRFLIIAFSSTIDNNVYILNQTYNAGNS